MAEEGAGMVQMGGGLPALPPRPPVPQRQAVASASTSMSIIPQRVPNVKQAFEHQLNIPPGSDLGAVGKIGVYQLAHTSSAATIHINLYFWIYLITACFILIKRR